MILHKESNDIMGLMVIYFSHVLHMKSQDIDLIYKTKKISSNKNLFEKFVNFIECKGFNL